MAPRRVKQDPFAGLMLFGDRKVRRQPWKLSWSEESRRTGDGLRSRLPNIVTETRISIPTTHNWHMAACDVTIADAYSVFNWAFAPVLLFRERPCKSHLLFQTT